MKRLYTLLIAVSCLCGSVQAQRLYTLQYCLEQGLKNNFALRITRNDQKIDANNATPANAGMLPELNLSGGYSGTVDNTRKTDRATGTTTRQNGVFDQSANIGLNLNWTLFDGFNLTTTYDQLKELKRQGETNTRIALEDMIANVASEYYNYIQQRIRLKNFQYAMSLSKERMRIVEQQKSVGTSSLLEYKQARVDFNADSAKYIKQLETIHTSRIALNTLIAVDDVDEAFIIRDSLIDVNTHLNFNELWEATLATNATLLKSDQNIILAQLDYKKIKSRDYPYLRLNTGYGYTFNKYDASSPTRRSSNLGFNAGITVGFKIFDGNRRRERRNARLEIENSRLEREELENSLRADLHNLWQAYLNNINLLTLERQNLITARDNYEIAMLRYLEGDLSGFEMRQAQQSLLDNEERILAAQYDAKICEISLLQISGKVIEYLK